MDGHVSSSSGAVPAIAQLRRDSCCSRSQVCNPPPGCRQPWLSASAQHVSGFVRSVSVKLPTSFPNTSGRNCRRQQLVKRAAQQGRAALAAANERAACSCPAGVDPHELLPADSNRGQVAAVARRTWASVAFAAGLHLDTAALTAANGAVFTVPILRPAGAGAGLVRAKALYEGLGVASPPWWLAQQQLNELGARLCTSAEIQLLKMLPGISRFLSGTSIVRVDAACRWLLSTGQREAAAQLAQRERQLAAAHGSAAGSLPAPNGPMPDREQTASAADSYDQSGPPDSGLQSSGEPAGWEAERQQCGYTPETVRTLAELMPPRT